MITMEFKGFNDNDFNVFHIDGLDERMEAIQSTIRPKFEQLGDMFAPTLTALTGDEMFPHVAKHARRTVNPPDDSWVAFANSNRGYKKLPHFQIGLWDSHLFAWFAVIYESPIKNAFGQKLETKLSSIQKTIPDQFVWSVDHTKPEAVSHQEADLKKMVDRLMNVKKAELLCGLHIEKGDPILENGDKLVNKLENTFKTLLPLYELAKQSSSHA